MSEPIRIYCDDPGYPDAWIDIESRWTLRDQDQMVAVADDEFWALLRRKTLACCIPAIDGDPVTDPSQLSSAGLAGVDVLLIGWLGSALPLAVSRRRALGNASARLLLPTSGGRTLGTTTPTTPTTPPATAAAQDA